MIDDVGRLARRAGYGPGDPLIVGVRQDGAPPEFWTSGSTAADTVVCTARGWTAPPRA
jgi:hypothetical protein